MQAHTTATSCHSHDSSASFIIGVHFKDFVSFLCPMQLLRHIYCSLYYRTLWKIWMDLNDCAVYVLYIFIKYIGLVSILFQFSEFFELLYNARMAKTFIERSLHSFWFYLHQNVWARLHVLVSPLVSSILHCLYLSFPSLSPLPPSLLSHWTTTQALFTSFMSPAALTQHVLSTFSLLDMCPMSLCVHDATMPGSRVMDGLG